MKIKTTTYIYTDGFKLSVEHCKELDGNWEHGDINEVIIKKDYPFYDTKMINIVNVINK